MSHKPPAAQAWDGRGGTDGLVDGDGTTDGGNALWTSCTLTNTQPAPIGVAAAERRVQSARVDQPVGVPDIATQPDREGLSGMP